MTSLISPMNGSGRGARAARRPCQRRALTMSIFTIGQRSRQLRERLFMHSVKACFCTSDKHPSATFSARAALRCKFRHGELIHGKPACLAIALTESSFDELCCYAFSPGYHLDLPGALRYSTLLILCPQLSPSSPFWPPVVLFPTFTAQVAFSQTLPQPLGHVHTTHQPSKHKPHVAQISHCYPTAATRPQNATAEHIHSSLF